MNKKELKKVLKPLVKQCINEVLLEEGLLSTVIAEIMKGTGASRIVESAQPVQPKFDNTAAREKKRKQLLEQKRKLLDAIGTESYNGVNLFEGTTPTTSAPAPGQTQPQGALSGVAPNDPGVDISSLVADSSFWKKAIGNKNG
tara:strand:- start:1329 stop:1757 length:429 start_codon:yes stop_codon:yes gene_type:complete